MKRAVSYALMGVVVAVALLVGTLDAGEARTVEERVQDIASTIRCPQCRSQSVADSEASTARAARQEIEERVEEGQSADEIRDYFASTYGEQILLRPPSTGVGALVWIIPVVAVVVAGAALFFAFPPLAGLDVSTSKERRAFLERSLADLDEEHTAGDLSDGDHARLRADYERRLAALDEPTASPTKRSPAKATSAAKKPAAGGSTGGRIAAIALVVVVAVGAGVALAGAVGRRDANDNITGADLDATEEPGQGPDQGSDTSGVALPPELQECVAAEADPPTAVDCYQEYRRTHDGDATAALLYGQLLLRLGNQFQNDDLLVTGGDVLRQAVEFDPGFAEARVYLATYLARTEQFEEARQVLAPLEGQSLPSDLQQLVDVIAPLLTTTTTVAP